MTNLSPREDIIELLQAMNRADSEVAPAVRSAIGEIADAVVQLAEVISKGGRLFYIGAGTSGRLGALDASEWYPTFGTEHGLVQALIAGGEEALSRSIEGAEDRAEQGAIDLRQAGAHRGDFVIGISASGTTPYVRGALQWCRSEKIPCAAIVCAKVPKLPADITIELPVGPEFIEGSSRLKAGTATKMALNMIGTVTMILLGRIHSNRMVNVRLLSDKLRRRAQDMVARAAAITPAEAKLKLEESQGDVKRAIVMARLKTSFKGADKWLHEHDQQLDELIKASTDKEASARQRFDWPTFFETYAAMETRRVLGLMSGTSADGVHAALVEISGGADAAGMRLIDFSHQPYSKELRKSILRLFEPECPVPHLCEMNYVLGGVFAAAARRLADKHGGLENIHLIASHGQTVCHLPPSDVPTDKPGLTLQIGEPAVIAQQTGVTVAADFRAADIAAGGQGAPLCPVADYLLFRHTAKGRAVQNIGGIANVTFIPAGAGFEEMIAFDTGPGNMLIDALMEALTEGRAAFDRNGEMALRGQPNEALLAWLMGHEFIRRDPPKTTGREEFGQQFADQVLSQARQLGIIEEDMIATATTFTAESIADAYRRFLFPKGTVDEVILGGGGTFNQALRQSIEDRLPGISVHTHEDFGIPGHAKEALAFALLGHHTALGHFSPLQQLTGAKRPVLLGKIAPGWRSIGEMS